MTAFISVYDLSDQIGRDVSDDDGAVIAVDSACDIVRTLTEQDFTPASETVRLDGTGTDCLLLPQVPVSAAGTVVANGETLTSDDYAVTENGHLIRTAGTADWSTWTTEPTAYWPRGRSNIEVTYEHGYSGTVPSDIRQVALSIAARIVTQGGALLETVGPVTKRYAAASTDLTNGESRILAKYRQVG